MSDDSESDLSSVPSDIYRDNPKKKNPKRVSQSKSYQETEIEQDEDYLTDSDQDGDQPSKKMPRDSSKSRIQSRIPLPDEQVELDKIVFKNGEQFLVKFQRRSYIHCEYVDRQWIEQNDRYGKGKLKKFEEKAMLDAPYQLLTVDMPYSESYRRIGRIIDKTVAKDPFAGEKADFYLVKWEGLQYDQCTWETLETLHRECEEVDQHLEQYYRVNKLRDQDYFKLPYGVRPPASSFKKYEESPIFLNDNKLHPHQIEGLNWILYCYHHSQNSIVGDVMGLGKTAQAVSFLDRLYHDFGVKGPFLVVAPLSTIPHWQRTFDTWSTMNALVYHGSPTSRSVCQHYEFGFKDSNGQKVKVVAPPGSQQTVMAQKAFNQFKFDVMITTYEMAMSASQVLKTIPWRSVVVDEAHRLKNKSSKTSDVLKTFQFEHRLLLTGTPIQNNLEELWAILNFLDPDQFPDQTKFMSQYNLHSAADVHRLQELLKPLMIRRLKEDVAKDIPPKEETIIEVEQTDIQRAYYKAILERNFSFLKSGTSAKNMPSLINTMMELRKCCIHPYLLTGAEEKILQQSQAGDSVEEHMKAMVQSSGKLVLLDKLLPKLKSQGHRVLIFSQMTRCLDILSDYLSYREYKHERIDGRIRGDLRQAAIDRFSEEGSDVFVFLLSTRAGGVGINLTSADTVILYDSDYNPQNDLQAQARCHRIGQDKNVKVYRLITRNTYEQKLFQKADLKLGIDKAVLSKASQDSINLTQGGVSALSRDEIENLLKNGAYGALNDDAEANQFFEADIDFILERRATTIVHGATETTEVGQNMFSKATFGLESQESQLDTNDPEFWSKWAARANINPDMLLEDQLAEQQLLSQPRKRKSYHDSLANLVDTELPTSAKDVDFKPERKRLFGVIPWTTADRTRIERSIMMFGFGSWEYVATNMIKSKSIYEIKAAQQRLIQWAVDKLKQDCKKPNGSYSREDLRLFEDVGRAVLSNKWDPPTIQEVEEMTAGTCQKRFVPVKDDFEVDPDFGRYPFPGADKEDLMTHYTYLDACPEEYLVTLEKKPRNLLLRVQTLHLLREDVLDIDPFAHVEVYEENPDGTMVNKYRKLFLNRQKTRKLDPALWSESFSDNLQPGLEQWTVQYDHDFTVAKLMYGYGTYTQYLTDPDLVFGKDGIPFPNPTDLGTRFRRLIAFCTKHFRKRDGSSLAAYDPEFDHTAVAKVAKVHSSAPRRQAENEQQELIWNRRHKQDLLAGYQTFGVPEDYEAVISAKDAAQLPWRILKFQGDQVVVLKRDWTEFKQQNQLTSKTDEAMENALQHFCHRAEQLLLEHFPDELNGQDGSIWPLDRRTMDASDGEIDQPALRLQLLDGVGQDLDLTEGVSYERVRRIIRRFSLLHSIRGVALPRPDLEEILLKNKKSPGLPSWWIDGTHDAALLKGCAKHGIASNRQNQIILDSELPFFETLVRPKVKPPVVDQLRELLTMDAATMKAKNIDDVVFEEKRLLNGKTLEDVVDWIKDAIRNRRIELSALLVCRETDAAITVMGKESRKKIRPSLSTPVVEKARIIKLKKPKK